MNLRLLPAVSTDLAECVLHYREIRAELGDQFRRRFDAALKSIQSRPKSFRVAFDQYRKISLRGFPHALYFRLEKDEILVVLLIHPVRSPELIASLLRQRKRRAA